MIRRENYRLVGLLLMMITSGVFAQHIQFQNISKYHRTDKETGALEFIRFREQAQPAAEGVTDFLKGALRHGASDEFRKSGTLHDQIGMQHDDYQQYHHGYPVFGARWKAHIRDGKVVSMNGHYVPLGPAPLSPMAEAMALQIALDDIAADEYMWEMPGQNAALQYATGNPAATYLPTGKLTYIRNDGHQSPEAWRLAWAFDIYAHAPLSRTDVYVDAVTGEVIFRNDKIHTNDAVGTAVTRYSGVQTITADSTGTTFRLRESGRASGVETYDMQRQTDYGLAIDFTDSDNYWDNANANLDEVAGDAHWGAEMTFDYFFQHHGRNSFDNAGAKLLSYIHYDVGYANAFWDGTRMTYGDGGSGFGPFPALDVVGHEFAHGVTGNSAGLIYQNESGALNESFSDIFGAAIEFFARPSNANWRIGEDLGGIRDMANPSQFGDPDTYHGNNWWFASGNNGGVHTNSGVQNFWFYLLSVGGNGTNDNGDAYSVSGIGMDSAAAIAYRNLSVYLLPMHEYEDARIYAIESAIDLFGECSPQMLNTMRAWHAVGVGSPYTGTLQAGFWTPDTSLCAVPGDVQFYNQSTSEFGYEWDFGDGTSSTQPNPLKTYTQPGVYDVRLIVTGCNGMQDTALQVGRVVIDVNQQCPVNMPTGGGHTILDACNGEIYDSGGALDYQNNNFSHITIDPGQGPVSVTFTSFEFAVGDFIRIYDGPDDLSPLIGLYAGSNSPGTVTSTGSAITIREQTNGNGTRSGFHATYSCVVGVEEGLRARGLEIFPNPASTRFWVRLTGGSGQGQVTLTDMQGRIMYTETSLMQGEFEKSIDIEHLSAGIYFLRVEDAQGQLVKKIRVQ